MKKSSLLFFALSVMSASMQSQLRLEPVKEKNATVELTFWQNFQLDYLSQELKQFSNIIATKWTDSTNTRILIERTELAVQESSTKTQEFMKKQIVQIFEKFGINIFFTSDNFIERVKKESTHKHFTHPVHPKHVDTDHDDEEHETLHPSHIHLHAHSDESDSDEKDISSDQFEEIHVKKSEQLPHKKPDTTPTAVTPQTLQRIHGGRRTLNKIKRRWEQEEKQLEAKRKLVSKDSFKPQKPKPIANKSGTQLPRPQQSKTAQPRTTLQQRLEYEKEIIQQRSNQLPTEPSSPSNQPENPGALFFYEV